MECHYYLGDKDKFYKHYRELINRKTINPLMASIGSHASIRFNISNKENPFCSDPFKYIKKQNITDNNELNDDLISSILDSIKVEKVTLKVGHYFQMENNLLVIYF